MDNIKLVMLNEALKDGAVSWTEKKGVLVAQFSDREDGLKERYYEPVIPDRSEDGAFLMFRDKYADGTGAYAVGAFI